MKGHRGRRGRAYTLITPENHYPSRLPEFGAAPVVKLVTPRLAPSRIGVYLVTLEGPASIAPGFETFLYGLEGDARVDGAPLGPGAFAYRPAGFALDGAGLLLMVKRRHEGAAPPAALHGHRDDEPFATTPVPGFTRRELLPVDDPAFDFAMSLLRFDAGVGLDNIEIHDEEHGLYMTTGAGDYHLDGEQHPVRAGDFIYMAPYCPQGFVASEPAEYLLYKDTWRDGF